MNADGSDPTPLTMGRSSNTDPIFSPDGSRIVFTSYPNGYGQIWQMNADGSAQKPLFTSDFTDYSPCFSPDGNNLTWVSARGNDTNFQIYRGGANGSSPVRLTSSGQNRAPSWSIGSVPTPTTPLATPISPSAPAS